MLHGLVTYYQYGQCAVSCFAKKKHFHDACGAYLTKKANSMDIFMHIKSKVIIQATFCQQI